MADLYLMCGPAGSGKSTWLSHHAKPSATIISRDQIRFGLIKPGEDYFSKENEVKKIFWSKINEALKNGQDVFVDQTSLTRRSRKYLLSHVSGYNHANIIWINVPIQQAIEQNENRKHGRAYVPQHVIEEMYKEFEVPRLDEGFYRIFKYENNKTMTMEGVKL